MDGHGPSRPHHRQPRPEVRVNGLFRVIAVNEEKIERQGKGLGDFSREASMGDNGVPKKGHIPLELEPGVPFGFIHRLVLPGIHTMILAATALDRGTDDGCAGPKETADFKSRGGWRQRARRLVEGLLFFRREMRWNGQRPRGRTEMESGS